MDTSKEYIKMCEKAGEIQGLRGSGLWVNGDFYTDEILKRPSTPVDFCVFEDASDEPCEMYHPVWLPRQDDLQGMVISTELIENDILRMIMYFQKFARDDYFKDERFGIKSFFSMEQLWFAFVMSEKYGKTWDGNDWVKV